MLQPNRSWQLGEAYSFGYNGVLMDDEVYGKGNLMATEFRMFDTRLGRWWGQDPIVKVWESPYAGMFNDPINYMDPSGLNGTGVDHTPRDNGSSEGIGGGAESTDWRSLGMAPPSIHKEGIAEKMGMAVITGIANEAMLHHIKENGNNIPFTLNGTYTMSNISGLGKSLDYNGRSYITDTDKEAASTFNMYVSNNIGFNVNESDASKYKNYEAFIVAYLMKSFASGQGPENYIFPENGLISSKFLQSDILQKALVNYKKTGNGMTMQYSFGLRELLADTWRNGTIFTVTGLTGSGTITIIPNQQGIKIRIFNITSLTSGTFGKEIFAKSDYPISYVRDHESFTSAGILYMIVPFSNISQTYNLFIPYGKF